jgi:DNA-binding Lrp family transcriptional regulator
MTRRSSIILAGAGAIERFSYYVCQRTAINTSVKVEFRIFVKGRKPDEQDEVLEEIEETTVCPESRD